MKATVGERVLIHGRSVGTVDRHGEIVEVRGDDGQPPYLVRFDDGHETAWSIKAPIARSSTRPDLARGPQAVIGGLSVEWRAEP